MSFGRLFLLGIYISLIAFASMVQAETKYAEPNPKAPKGGTVTYNMSAEPPTIHPIASTDYYSEQIKAVVFDSLAIRDNNTFEFRSRLAEKWEISENKKVFTFHLRKNLTFHDGKPITAEDVKFSFDAIFEPKYKAAHMQPYFEGIEKVEAIDPLTVRATAKDTYFLNFSVIATMNVVPKHIYSDVEASAKMTRTAIGSGPYKLDKFERGQRIVLKRFDKWYGFSAEDLKGFYNFDTIVYRMIKEENVVIEALKKGEVDLIDFRSPDVFVQKTQGPPWGQTIFKNQVENSMPKGYGYIGFNFRKELFKDKNVRLALSHMLNREEMNKKFRYDMSLFATGPTNIQSDYANTAVKPILFDVKKAQELLAKSGWKDTDKDGLLDKIVNGKKVDFKFTMIHAAKDREKYWTMYKEDLKKVGIEMEIKLLEWNTMLKILDEGNFDVIAMGWSTVVEWDPKQIWHSSSAVAGGSNFIAYKNPEVDKLIDKARYETDRKKRMEGLRKVYKMIADDVPYIFMFNDKYFLYANTDKVVKPGDTMKYDLGNELWWSAKP